MRKRNFIILYILLIIITAIVTCVIFLNRYNNIQQIVPCIVDSIKVSQKDSIKRIVSSDSVFDKKGFDCIQKKEETMDSIYKDNANLDSIFYNVLPSLKFYFPQNQSEFDMGFSTNSVSANLLDSLLKKLKTIDSLYIIGCTSPEGYESHNVQLAKKRAESLKRFILTKYNKIPINKISSFFKVVDWREFKRLVISDPYVPNLAKILSIIDNNDLNTETKNEQIKHIDSEVTWEYLLKNTFPQLRTSELLLFGEIDSVLISKPKEEIKDTISEEFLEDSTIAMNNRQQLFAVHTNMLYWLLLTPNIGFDVFFKNHWSIGVEGGYNWLETRNKTWRYKMWYLEPELKYYFTSNKINNGHTVNLKYHISNFNIMSKRNGHQGWLYGGSIGYSYLKKLDEHWNIDFGINFGLLYTDIDKYRNWPNNYMTRDDEFLSNTKSIYYGVTGLRIGITYRLY